MMITHGLVNAPRVKETWLVDPGPHPPDEYPSAAPWQTPMVQGKTEKETANQSDVLAPSTISDCLKCKDIEVPKLLSPSKQCEF